MMEIAAKIVGAVCSFGKFIKHSLSLFLVRNLRILSALIEHNFVLFFGGGSGVTPSYSQSVPSCYITCGSR